MTEADEAYEAAERLIEEARRNAWDELSFVRKECRALEALPPGIGQLNALRRLDLEWTRVTDLGPIAGLTNLTHLWLENTPTSDLRPLSRLAELEVLLLGGTRVSDLAPLSNLTSLIEIWLDDTQIRNLEPLSKLSRLNVLSLADTKVSDLRPITGLTDLGRLVLDGTAVTDLRPVRSLVKLATNPLGDGLSFSGAAAALSDKRIAQIAAFKRQKQRARTLFDYLEHWEPPGGGGESPAPDDLFGILTEDGKLEVAQSLPTEAERDARLKRVLHDRLRVKAGDLALAAGNRFPRLAIRARAVLAQVDRPFEEVDLLLLHLEVEDLSARAAAGREDDDPFPPEVTGPLSDVLSVAPALTLGHPDVDLLHARINAFRGQPIPVDEKAAHDAMSAVTAQADAAIGDRLGALERRIESLPAELALVTQRAVHRNMIWRLAVGGLTRAETIGLNVVSSVVAAHFHTPIVAFVQANWPILMDVALTYGSAFAQWFAAAVGSVPDLTALSRETLRRLKGGR